MSGRLSVHALAIALALSIGVPTGVVADTLALSPEVPSLLYPRAIQLAGDTAAFSWTGADHSTWVQRVGSDGTLIGTITRVGQLTSGEEQFASDPIEVALPDGDLVLVGALRDGRIAFVRGSTVATRRIAPRVLIRTNDVALVGFSAAATATGFAVLTLRSTNTETLEGSMNATLHQFGQRGEMVVAPTTWPTANGFAVRLAVCDGVFHLAWRTAGGVVMTRFDQSLKRSGETLIPDGRETLSGFGPMLCVGSDAHLLTSLQRGSRMTGAAPELAVAASTSMRRSRATWSAVKLPGEPQSTLTRDRAVVAYQAGGKAKLLVNREGTNAVVTVDLKTLRTERTKLNVGDGTCWPAPDMTRAVCGGFASVATKSECHDALARPTLSFSGGVLSNADESPFWLPGEVANVNRLAAHELAALSQRLVCGAPEWGALRTTLERWCRSEAHQVDSAPYCAPGVPSSLLYQAVHCQDQPVGCAPTDRTHVPSVSRREFQAGRVELRYATCSMWFLRRAQAWTVESYECTGED